MSAVMMFLVGVATTLLSASLVVIYLRFHLKSLLTDLCGTPQRAEFWTAFSNVTLMLVPVIFALNYRPEVGSLPSLVFALSTQLEEALIGLVCSVLLLGIVVSTFIRRRQAVGAPMQERHTA
jgi:hypothetical protein